MCAKLSVYGLIVFKSVRDIMRVIVAICRYVSDVDFTAGAWPRSHAGIDPIPDNMNLDYLKLRYREFQKYEVMTTSVVGGQPKKRKKVHKS